MAERARDRAMVGGAVMAALAAAAVVVVLAFGALAVGVGGGGDETPRRESPRRESPEREAVVRQSVTLDAGDVVHLGARPTADTRVPLGVVPGLDGGDVLRIRVSGLAPGAGGRVEQCVVRELGPTDCHNRFPVQVGPEGVALFQYQLQRGPGACGPVDGCVVVVSDGDHVASAYTVFGARAPEPVTLRLVPPGPYRAGQRVEVEVAGVPAGTEAGVVVCSPRCDDVTPLADAGAVASAEVSLPGGCDDRRCTLRVTGLGAAGAEAVVAFAAPLGVRYDAGRVAAGLALAVAFLAIAVLVIRRTDWRAPSEAATPELDAA
ncbi:MAG: hypothetical protein KatS3mg010_1620 [Acidimicrobiia bacterium]|nr:MAG: hypothetical protein KatS3mg010_1620 [Acidimicrobiia bacterium]